jgi:Predicted membrane protein
MMSRNARVGLWLFGVYLLFYAGFVGLSAFSPQSLRATPVAGLNLALLYGFALILVALLLSLVYGLMCHPSGDRREDDQ